MIYLRVSLINGCHYCAQHHVASSKRVGLTAEDWSALKAGDYSRYTEKERAALTYVEKLTRTPHDINDADFAPLKTQFSEPEIVDIHLLTGLANLTNRFTDPLGTGSGIPGRKDLTSPPRIHADFHGSRNSLLGLMLSVQIRANPWLKNFPRVAHAPGHPLPVQIFQQGNGILPADPGQLLELGHIHLRRLRPSAPQLTRRNSSSALR